MLKLQALSGSYTDDRLCTAFLNVKITGCREV